jgi:GH43 family beta-xylosidase
MQKAEKPIDANISKLRITFWSPFSGGDGQFMDALVQQYNNENTDHVKVEQINNNSGDYYTKLATAIVTEEAPDIAIVHSSKYSQYTPAGFLTDMNELALEAGVHWEDFNPTIMKSTVMNDKHYGIPLDTHLEHKDVWFPPVEGKNSSNVWAPELHYVNGKWYIYYAADDGVNENHRMFVLESETEDPLGKYTDKGMMDTAGRWAIDGTIFQKQDGSLYFIWSGWEGTVNVSQHLYIAPMSNPYTISGTPVEISRPELDWELNGTPTINEGPEVLVHGDNVFVIYSASGSWTDDYCLGMLSTQMGSDLLNPSAWQKHDKPVFSKTDNVFGPGHCSFIQSVDGKEDWILYHAAKMQGSGWNRNVRMQPFQWNADGTPYFATPIAEGVAIHVPSGE